eukprot:SAG31_NODE_2495_length_5606_cov_5.934084_1_plen_115_part_10
MNMANHIRVLRSIYSLFFKKKKLVWDRFAPPHPFFPYSYHRPAASLTTKFREGADFKIRDLLVSGGARVMYMDSSYNALIGWWWRRTRGTTWRFSVFVLTGLKTRRIGGRRVVGS